MRCRWIGRLPFDMEFRAPGTSRRFTTFSVPRPAPWQALREEAYRGGYARSWALVVGVSRYPNAAPVPYAVEDARTVSAALRRSGFASGRIIELLDGEATRQNIQDVLSVELVRRTGRDDRVVVFFAGHGRQILLASGRRMGFLLPWDAEPQYTAARCLSMDLLAFWSECIPAKHMLFVLDCCHAGAASGFSAAPVRPAGGPGEWMRRRVRQVLSAGADDERSFERDGHGLFTRWFVRAMLGEADTAGRGYVDARQLARYVGEKVLRESRGMQQPRLGYWKGCGEFVFWRAHAQVSVPVPAARVGSRVRRDAACLVRHIRRGGEMGEWLAAHEALGGQDWCRERDARALWLTGCCRLVRSREARLAVSLFERAARAGYAPAQYSLALCLLRGLGTASDAGLARGWLLTAARQRYPEAQLALGLWFRCPPRLAAERLADAARRGSVRALFNLALCLEAGYGLPPDADAAARLMDRCVRAGYGPARRRAAQEGGAAARGARDED